MTALRWAITYLTHMAGRIDTRVPGLGGGAAALVPWVRNPFRLVSLMEIINCRVHLLCWETSMLAHVVSQIQHGRMPVDSTLEQISLALKELYQDASMLDLRSVKAQIERIQHIVSNPRAPFDVPGFGQMLSDLVSRLHDELKAQCFLFVPHSSLYMEPLKEWSGIVERFRLATFDIEEGCRCLALGRYTASSYHFLRVMERGLNALGERLHGDQYLPSWDAKLRKIETALDSLDRKVAPKEDWDFFQQAKVNFRAVQTAWRNPTMHIEKTYTEQGARDIMNATRVFMEQLASRLGDVRDD